MTSLKGRLGIGLFLSLAIALPLLWFSLSASIRYLAEGYINTRLAHDSETILGTVTFDNEGRPVIDKSRLDVIYQKPFSGYYFKIFSEGYTLRSRSLWDQDLDMDPDSMPTGSHASLHLTGPEHQPLLVLLSSYRKHNRTLSIAVAEDLSSLETGLYRFQWQFTLAAIGTLVLLVIIQAVIVRNSMKPLIRIQTELRELEQGQRQSLDAPVPTEITPLINEINRLLRVTSQRLKRSRHALGDLAHTLKKPLTVLRQLSTDDALQQHDEIKRVLEEQTTAMHRSMDRVLRQARIAGEGATGSSFTVGKETEALLRVLKTLYRDKELTIETRIPPDLVIPFDREDMHELLGNVLDNAFKWARQTVHVQVRTNDTVDISIEDDGPGTDPDLLCRLTERGTRLDESVDGHGIGLGIVKDIVDQYHGDISFTRSEQLGGLCVSISLPGRYSAD